MTENLYILLSIDTKDIGSFKDLFIVEMQFPVFEQLRSGAGFADLMRYKMQCRYL